MGSGPGPPRPQKVQKLNAEFLIEPGAESPERTFGYVLQAAKSTCRNIRDGCVVTLLYNEDGDLVGMDVSGTPSVTFQKELDEVMERFAPSTGGSP